MYRGFRASYKFPTVYSDFSAMQYRTKSKMSDTRTVAVIHLKFEICGFTISIVKMILKFHQNFGKMAKFL